MERAQVIDPGDDRRQHYRIIYPPMVQPRFVIHGVRDAARVLDCSESGIRYEPVGGSRPSAGDVVRGRVHFHPRRLVEVEGEVIRIGREDVALRLLHPGIPLATIFAEQRHLMRLYPDGFEPRQRASGAVLQVDE